MKSRTRLRRTAHLLRAAGLTMVALALNASVLYGTGATGLAAPFTGLRSLVAQVMPVPGLGTPVPDATPTPPPTPPPVGVRMAQAAKKAAIVRGGPLRLGVTGNLALGEHGFSNSRMDGSGTNASQATQSAGLLLELGRRTAATNLTIGVPMGVSGSQRSTVGQVQIAYYTPRYGLQYMQQPLSALGGIPLGSSLEAFGLVLPLSGGDVTFYQGGGYLNEQNRARLYGVRARRLIGRSLAEFGFVQAARVDGGGRASTLIAGFANVSGNLNQVFEAALQSEQETGQSRRGASAFQYLFNYGSAGTYSTFSLKHISRGFESLGGGALQGDDQFSGGLHAQNVTFQETFDRIDNGESVTQSRAGALSFYRQLGSDAHPVSMMWQLGDQRTAGSAATQWVGSAGLQLGTSFGNTGSLFGLQSTRSTSLSGPPISSFSYQAGFQKPIGSMLAQLQIENARLLSGSSFTRIAQSLFSLTRQFGSASLTLSDGFTHTQTPGSDQLQTAPLLTLQRRLSPALSLGLSYGMQTTRDALNPDAGGHTRLFSLQLTAPFAVGTGVVQGRSNPHLPASIAGTVVNGIGNQGPFSAAVSNGVSNVAIVLDGSEVQRTDLAGHYQFNFVTPGQHTVQIELASLPRGVTPDQPIASIFVLGGQEGSVNFQISTYGAILGHVMGRDPNGAPVPVPGVVFAIDKDGGLATSGAEGVFGFGRLEPGMHVITIQEGSLPATVALTKADLTQKVLVRAGEVAKVEFLAGALGSVAGSIVFDSSLAPGHRGGAFNSYVVAEPGDFAAIADEDGSFLMDNLPPGTYTVDVDPETLPPDTGNNAGPQTITVGPGRHVEGIRFTIARKEKAVVFSFKTSEAASAAASLEETVLPPGGATRLAVDAGANSSSVTATAFGSSIALSYDHGRKKWVGTVLVPPNAHSGTASVTVQIHGPRHYAASVDLRVDDKMPLATFSLTPRHAPPGQYTRVRARFLADVHPGDAIRWADGQVTKLGAPLTGRVYEFSVKISVHPFHGLLLTRQGQLPITLQ